MPRLLISARSFGTAYPPALDALRALGLEVNECREGPELDRSRLEALARESDFWVFAFTPIPGDLLASCPRLRGIIKHGVGLDNVDMAAATRLGIPVLTAPGGTEHAVPEHALGLLFGLARHVFSGHQDVLAGHWRRSVGTGIHGKTLGILGLGRIGRNLATKASGLGVRTLGFDPLVKALPAEARTEHASFDRVIAESDFLIICTPLTDETRGLFNAATLANCRPGVLIVNCARGGIVDEAAMAAALHCGHIGGYGADVFEKEPPKGSPLLEAPRTLFSAHCASYSEDSLRLMGERVVAGVRSLLAGERPAFLMNPDVAPGAV